MIGRPNSSELSFNDLSRAAGFYSGQELSSNGFNPVRASCVISYRRMRHSFTAVATDMQPSLLRPVDGRGLCPNRIAPLGIDAELAT